MMLHYIFLNDIYTVAMSTLRLLESILIRFWFELPVHTILKTGFTKTSSGGGFAKFSSAESNLHCSMDRESSQN